MPNSNPCFGCNLFKPCKCKGILRLFKMKPFSRIFKFLHHKAEKRRSRRSSRKFRSIHAVFWPLMSMRSDERDRIGEGTNTTVTHEIGIERETVTVQSVSPVPVELEPLPIPLTSPLIEKMKERVVEITSENTEENDVKKACRSFEKYLMEMLVEERKIRDLLDVEELMFCMDKLKSPAFVELVCTFYGELCMDLFSNDGSGDEIEAV
ncbi:hypothetical protein LUZ60_013125 [Juncus effusus]|nr:hypothetical protein LUZ60_013125 [Juncus effusus]